VLVMERLHGFHYDDIEGMKAAGIDTAQMVRSLMISFLEGAMIYGVFHGDLHGGNLSVLPDGRVALYDYGMTGRMEESAAARLPAHDDDRRRQRRARPARGLPRPRGAAAGRRPRGDAAGPQGGPARARPTRMSTEELVHEIQDVIKGLLRQGARLPKHLMLYVKNMLFFDGSIARFAPDVNLFAEVAKIYAYFAMNHAESISRDVGIDPSQNELQLDNLRAQLGLESDVESLTHRELRHRRAQIQKRIDAGGGLPRG
jgi:ubiquinone biosynthesis protein